MLLRSTVFSEENSGAWSYFVADLSFILDERKDELVTTETNPPETSRPARGWPLLHAQATSHQKTRAQTYSDPPRRKSLHRVLRAVAVPAAVRWTRTPRKSTRASSCATTQHHARPRYVTPRLHHTAQLASHRQRWWRFWSPLGAPTAGQSCGFLGCASSGHLETRVYTLWPLAHSRHAAEAHRAL